MRWIYRYAPELEKRARSFQRYGSTSWRVDETYIKVGGRWKYPFWAVDKHGALIDFMLLERRNTRAAYRFLSKALTTMREWPASSITTDKLRSYPETIERLKREGKLSTTAKHRTSKYLNNIIEADHGALKQVIRPTRGFQTMKSATATIKGFEIMRMIRPGHCLTFKHGATTKYASSTHRSASPHNHETPQRGTIRLQQVNATEPQIGYASLARNLETLCFSASILSNRRLREHPTGFRKGRFLQQKRSATLL